MTKKLPGHELQARIRKEIPLCINLDPPTSLNAKERKKWLLHRIDHTSQYSIAMKINLQYIIGMDLSDIQEITDLIVASNNVPIIDSKISDIGASNYASLYWAKKAGFQLSTASPFPGNAQELYEYSQELRIGIINLVLMSNADAQWLVKAVFNEEPVYIHFARLTQQYFIGAVIGAGGYIQESHLQAVQSLLREKIILVPGIGAQGGKTQIHEKIFGRQILYSVGRAIARAENPEDKAKEYYNILKKKVESG